VYLGTTDTDYDGPIDEPCCTPEDVAYILDAMNTFTTSALTVDDVVGTWAGLRPLVRSADSERTADLSRRHKLIRSASGVITITGGKLTTYRKMAADTVDEVVRDLGRGARRSRTKHLQLRGAAGTNELRRPDAADRLGTDPATLAHLVDRYGTEARTLLAMVQADPDLGRPLAPGLPYLRAEVVHATRYEMATTLEDVLARRTRALLLDRNASVAAAPDAANLMAPELGWSKAEIRDQVESFLRLAAREGAAAGLPAAGLLA